MKNPEKNSVRLNYFQMVEEVAHQREKCDRPRSGIIGQGQRSAGSAQTGRVKGLWQ
jgi:hypothetical protein